VSSTIVSSNNVITYTLSLTVTAATATNVQITDPLPAHLVYVSTGAVPAGGTSTYNTSSATLTWNWASLAPGTYSLTYQAQVDSYVTQNTVISNCAQVTASGAPGGSACQPVSMAQIYTVQVGVYNTSGELVKQVWVQELSQPVNTFQLENATISSLNGTTYVEFNGVQIASWNGTNQNGDPVSNGEYYVKVDNINPYGSVTSVSQTVLVSRSIAKVEVDIYNTAGEIVRHLYAYEDDPNNAPMTQVSLSSTFLKTSVAGSNGGSSGSVTIMTPNGASIVWDGRSDSGSLVANGSYMVQVSWTTGSGSAQVITKGIVVQSDNSPVTNGNVWAQPNILKGGVTTTSIQVNSTNSYTLTVRLYDIAGELMARKTVVGPSGANQATLDVSGLASGLYFAVVDLFDASGNFNGHQTTQLVIQR
jgi:fimbrial isopeptide formation D2 family protein